MLPKIKELGKTEDGVPPASSFLNGQYEYAAVRMTSHNVVPASSSTLNVNQLAAKKLIVFIKIVSEVGKTLLHTLFLHSTHYTAGFTRWCCTEQALLIIPLTVSL